MTDFDVQGDVYETAAELENAENMEPAGQLRYAALKLIEGASDTPAVASRGEYMVAYGEDVAVYEAHSRRSGWWDETGPVKNAHRIAIVCRDADTITPKVCRIMAVIGARLVNHVSDDTSNLWYGSEGGGAYHFIMPDESAKVEAFERYLEYREERA